MCVGLTARHFWPNHTLITSNLGVIRWPTKCWVNFIWKTLQMRCQMAERILKVCPYMAVSSCLRFISILMHNLVNRKCNLSSDLCPSHHKFNCIKLLTICPDISIWCRNWSNITLNVIWLWYQYQSIANIFSCSINTGNVRRPVVMDRVTSQGNTPHTISYPVVPSQRIINRNYRRYPLYSMMANHCLDQARDVDGKSINKKPFWWHVLIMYNYT